VSGKKTDADVIGVKSLAERIAARHRPKCERTRQLGELGTYEIKAERLIDKIVGSLDAALSSGTIADEHIATILFEIFPLEEYFEPLLENLRLLDPQRAELSQLYLAQLLGACFRVGQLTRSDIAKSSQALIARRAKAASAAERKIALDRAIVAEAEDLHLRPAAGEKFARRILPGVRKRLGVALDDKGWPSVSTIKRAILKQKNRTILARVVLSTCRQVASGLANIDDELLTRMDSNENDQAQNWPGASHCRHHPRRGHD
jgi:hypothetical protein